MRILFLSREDRCRGPMARAIADRLARKEGIDGHVFDSAGLDVPNSQPATEEVMYFLRQERFNIAQHRSKYLSEQVADGADVILCMTKELVERARKAVGDYYAPKVLLLNEAVDMPMKRMDVDSPEAATMDAYRRIYAALSATIGRLVRNLEDPGADPEMLGARTIAKKYKPGTAGAGASGAASALPPEKRRFLANQMFDFIERSFDAPTTPLIQEDLAAKGHAHATGEIEEILKQDLHGHVRVDRDGTWHVMPGASEKRRNTAREEARARLEEKKRQSRIVAREEKMTVDLALETLGISRTTSLEDARGKYKQLVKRYHPDKFHDDPEFRDMAEYKAKRINEAWAMVEGILGEDV